MSVPVKDYLKTAEVARVLGVSTQTVYNWLKTGKCPEPERHPLTAYRLWTVRDVDILRQSMLESRFR